MEFVKTWLISLFAVLVLVACGGGGGGGGDEPAAGVAVAITAGNAEQVTGVVVGSVDAVEGLSEGGAGSLLGVSIQTDTSGFEYADFIRQTIEWFPVVREQALGSGIAGVVIGPETIPCSELFGAGASGTVTISGEVLDPFLDTISVGDSISMSFNNCDDGIGTLLNGGLSFRVADLSGDPNLFNPPYSLTIDADLNNFTVVEAGQTYGGDGDMMMNLAENLNETFEMSVSGSSLTSIENGMASTLSNYSYAMTGSNVLPFEYTLSMNGTLDSDEIGGWVSFETVELFEGMGEDPPYTGMLLVTGDNSKCQLVSQPDAINAEILVDADGNGEYEETIMTTWIELM